MDREVLEIVKQKDDYRVSIEISENAKQEPQVTVKVRGDGSAEQAGKEAIAEYKRIREEMK